MSEPSAAVQKAIYDALIADTTLKTLMGGTVKVFDRVPPNSPKPYISIGEDQALDEGNVCEPDIFEFFATLHVWSEVVGGVEAKNIAGRVREILKTLTVTGFVVDSVTNERLDHLKDPDGLTSHSVLTERLLIRIA